MESRASYFLVGFFVLVLTVGLLGGVLWLTKFQSEHEVARYEIIFDGTVTGLSEGSPVRFAGVNVGQVTALDLFEEDPTKVRMVIEVERMTPIKTDTIAALEHEGLTGKRYILLAGSSAGAEALVPEEGRRLARIPARSSSLEQLLEGAPETIESVNLLLAKANDLLNDTNRSNLAGILANIAVFSQSLADNSGTIATVLDDTSATMANLRDATAALQDMAVVLQGSAERLSGQAEITLASIESVAGNADSAVVEVRGDLRALLGNMNKATTALRSTLGQIEGLVAENREPIRDFTGSGLYEVSSLLIELRALIKQFNRVTTEVERDPARFFFGDSQQGYEAGQ